MRCRYRFDAWAWQITRRGAGEAEARDISSLSESVIPADRPGDGYGSYLDYEFDEPWEVPGTKGDVCSEEAQREFLCDFTSIRVEAEFAALRLENFKRELLPYTTRPMSGLP